MIEFMQNLTNSEIDRLFTSLKEKVLGDKEIVFKHLASIKPSYSEGEILSWRYRLAGYLEGLCACDMFSTEDLNHSIAQLFGKSHEERSIRPGRCTEYSIDIKTENSRVFSFDVPATNPFDAYFQLSKRVAYKSIPDIESVIVHSGFINDRDEADPLRTFNKDELVFVSLV